MKKGLLILLLVCLCLTMFACGNTDNANDVPDNMTENHDPATNGDDGIKDDMENMENKAQDTLDDVQDGINDGLDDAKDDAETVKDDITKQQ